MRMSCNGCRVLRKGCSENCTIRPCLQWIKTPDSQANATVFLAKFYGRAGLLNLINAGPPNLRPAIFRSLLYEACGRIVNPINGSVGLLWSGSWHLCQAAVESVLKGAPIAPIAADNTHGPPFKPCDIRHVIKDDTSNPKLKTRCRLKRPGPAKPAEQTAPAADRSISHDSTLSHHSELDGETESMVSADARPLFRSEDDGRNQDVVEVGLELTLGLDSVGSGRPGGASQVVVPVKKRRLELGGMCEVALGLDAYGV